MKRRRGFSLIEMVMLITVASIVLGLCAVTLQLLIKVDRSGRSHIAGLAREAHLARIFRADVRAARGATSAAPNTLMLELDDDDRVEYRLEGKEVLRVERVRDAIRNQDAFPLPRGGSARFDVEPLESLSVVRLIIARAPAAPDLPAGRATHLEGVLGQDHRFDTIEK
jgi:type II secretory pathway pseudopilin PulG